MVRISKHVVTQMLHLQSNLQELSLENCELECFGSNPLIDFPSGGSSWLAENLQKIEREREGLDLFVIVVSPFFSKKKNL